MVSQAMKNKYGIRHINGEMFYLVDYHMTKKEAQRRAINTRKTGSKSRVFKGRNTTNDVVWLVFSSLSKRKRSARAKKQPRLLLKEVKYSLSMSAKEKETWSAFGNLKGVWYEVWKTGTGSVLARGSIVSWFRTRSRERAIKFLKSHSTAKGIYRHKGKGFPVMIDIYPKTIKVNGKTYTRAYRGPHTKTDANKFVNGFRKEGLKAVARKAGKQGWMVYYR